MPIDNTCQRAFPYTYMIRLAGLFLIGHPMTGIPGRDLPQKYAAAAGRKEFRLPVAT